MSLRDALIAVAEPWGTYTASDGFPAIFVRTAEEIVDAILATPELMALNSATFLAMTEPPFVHCRHWCDEFLPEHVREWVIQP